MLSISSKKDIPIWLQNSPIAQLLMMHNLEIPQQITNSPEMLIVTCMDYRINLKIPDNFAFIIRTAGAHITNQTFPIAFALSTNTVKAIALIGHTDCKMVNITSRKKSFIDGITTALGWNKQKAEQLFNANAPHFAIEDEVMFIKQQTDHLRTIFTNTLIVPLLYNNNDHKLYLLDYHPTKKPLLKP